MSGRGLIVARLNLRHSAELATIAFSIPPVVCVTPQSSRCQVHHGIHHRKYHAGVGLSHGCVDGSVLGPNLAEFEQVAAARRAKSSREYPLQRGAKRDIASGQIVLLCASSKAV